MLRDIMAQRLQNRDVECLTIRSLSSEDDIPLGTDLDPSVYANLWAARNVRDPSAKNLLQYNLSCRVLDAENIGHSYGREVLGKRQYCAEGVIKAVEHFRKENLEVIVVTKRQDVPHFGEGVEVVIADSDDVIVARQAQRRNCPIVSRDNYREHKKDCRLSQDLRKWLERSSCVQIKFSWGTRGEFVPDYDLPCPVVRATRAAADSQEASSSQRRGNDDRHAAGWAQSWRRGADQEQCRDPWVTADPWSRWQGNRHSDSRP